MNLMVNFHISNDFVLLCLLFGLEMQNITNGDHSSHLRVQFKQLSDF